MMATATSEPLWSGGRSWTSTLSGESATPCASATEQWHEARLNWRATSADRAPGKVTEQVHAGRAGGVSAPAFRHARRDRTTAGKIRMLWSVRHNSLHERVMTDSDRLHVACDPRHQAASRSMHFECAVQAFRLDRKAPRKPPAIHTPRLGSIVSP